MPNLRFARYSARGTSSPDRLCLFVLVIWLHPSPPVLQARLLRLVLSREYYGKIPQVNDGQNASPYMTENAVQQPDEDSTRLRDQRIAGIPRNVLVTGLVSFFTDVSSEMVYPLVPLFLTSVLGVGTAAVGLIEGVAETTASLTKAYSGWLSDRLGRRKVLLVVGYGLSALTRIGLALSTSWTHVLLTRFADRLGKGIRTAPRDAIVADCSTEAELGRNFGLHRALDTLGATLGPAIAAGILWLAGGGSNGYRAVFWFSLIPGLLAVLLLVGFLVESKRVCTSGFSWNARRLWASPDFRRSLLPYLAITGLFAVGNSSDAFLLLRAQSVGLSVALIPILYLVFNLVYASVSIPAGVLADRIGRRKVLVCGFALFALAYAAMARVNRPWQVWAIFVLYGVYMGISDGNGRALLAELTPTGAQATAFGLYHAVVGLAALPASLIAGLLWQRLSPSAPFFLGAATAVLAALGFILLVGLSPRNQERVTARDGHE